MAKFAKKMQSDEFELLQYKMDLLDKRLDNLEKMIHNKSDSGLNAELMQFVMTLLKQQTFNTVQPSVQVQTAPTKAADVASASSVSDLTTPANTTQCVEGSTNLLESFMRRRTFV
jgi:hypothetical protein